MENNVRIVKESKELAEGAGELVRRCLELSGKLVAADHAPAVIERGGRKAHPV
jgi:hypothetical protein